MFFNELDLLEIRLNELDSVVDQFVIVESLELHGSKKTRSACLADNWGVVKSFEHKIKYVVLERLAPEYTDPKSGWARENFHRNSLMTPVIELSTSPDDVVVVSDCDEIPRASAIIEALPLMERGIHFLCLDLFYYNVNRYVCPWSRSTIGTLADYQRAGGFQSPRGLLDMPPTTPYPVIPDAGWHFSYFGSLAGIRSKVGRILQHGTSTFCQEFLARAYWEAAVDIASGNDLYRRAGQPQFSWRESNDPRLPVHFLNNKTRYEKYTEDFFKAQNRVLL